MVPPFQCPKRAIFHDFANWATEVPAVEIELDKRWAGEFIVWVKPEEVHLFKCFLQSTSSHIRKLNFNGFQFIAPERFRGSRPRCSFHLLSSDIAFTIIREVCRNTERLVKGAKPEKTVGTDLGPYFFQWSLLHLLKATDDPGSCA